jgi:hypothetical protein
MQRAEPGGEQLKKQERRIAEAKKYLELKSIRAKLENLAREKRRLKG